MLFVLGVSGLAVLGAATVKNRELAQTSALRGEFAAIDPQPDQPVQAAAGPSNAVASRADTPNRPAAMLAELSAAPTTVAMAGTEPAVPIAGLFGVGDRLKVAFYERVDVEEDRWRRASSASALRGILLRPEVSGEYSVQEDGTISVPLLGSIPAANRSAQQLHADLSDAFDQLMGRKGMVNILLLERPPIYVLGPVKNPGSFKYTPGMTILHAIALAGGLDRDANEPWQKIEAVREIQRRVGTVGVMLRAIAREAVLKAERDGTEPKIPLRLLELVGASEAANLVNEQRERRKAVATSRKNRERASLTGLELAKQDVAIYGRIQSLDELVKLRQDRVNSMRALVDRNVLSVTVLNQVQGELSDAEQRRKDALNQYAATKQRLASMEAEASRVQAELKNDLEVEIEAVERQVADNEREFDVSEGVLSVLPATRTQFTKQAARVTYRVVRQTPTGPIGIESVEMTLLQPGDLVNIVRNESEPREQADWPVPTLPLGERVQAGNPSPAIRAETDRAIEAPRIGPR